MFFAAYQHKLYLILFYYVLLFTIYYGMSRSYTEDNNMNYLLIFTIILIIAYYYLKSRYGINKILPRIKDYPLDKLKTYIPDKSIIERDIDSGRGFLVFIEFYPILHSTNYIYSITTKNSQYHIGYDPNSGDLIIKLVSSTDKNPYFDNVFTIPNLRMQYKNRLLLNVHQDVLTVYLNKKQYSFKMSGLPRIVNSNITIGQENGLKGDISRYLYLPYPIKNVNAKRLIDGIYANDKKIMNFVPIL